MNWMLMPLRRYAEFSGRSRRKEYWMYVLFLIIVGLVLGLIEGATGLTDETSSYGPLSGLFSLATLVPSLAVSVRRLHDTDRSGWWVLIGFVPYLLLIAALLTANLAMMGLMVFVAIGGGIVLLIFMVLEGTKGPNRYGPDPKGEVPDEVFA